MKNKEIKISFCMVCMNRLHHLRETLPQNILDNADYDNVEFILLDYNSADGMMEWVKENMSNHIASGKVVYYKTFDPKFYQNSHSINLALKLGGGDIVCSVNSDHYTGPGFARYVNEQFAINSNIVLTPIPGKSYHMEECYPPGENWGKVCLKKSDFLKARGLDESMFKWGSQDIDFVNRLDMLGLKRVLINNPAFWRLITHDNEERHSSRKIIGNVDAIYIHHQSSWTSNIIFLFPGQIFEKARFTDNRAIHSDQYVHAYIGRNRRHRYSTEDIDWIRGRSEEIVETGTVALFNESSEPLILKKKTLNGINVLSDGSSGEIFYEVVDPDLFEGLSKLNYTFYNVVILDQNLRVQKPCINMDSFGRGTVFRNFQFNTPIPIA